MSATGSEGTASPEHAAATNVAPANAVEVRHARPEDASEVGQLLHTEFAGNVSVETFSTLFAHGWSPDGGSPGLVAEADGKIVGFLGTIHSSRTDATGETYRVCSLSSWYVRPSYRSVGLAMLLRVINQRDTAVVCLSPNQNAAPIYRKCGLVETSEGFDLYPPWIRHTSGGAGKYRVIKDRRIIRSLLSPRDQQIYDDHATSRCSHYVIAGATDNCYVVTKRRIGQTWPRLPITEVLYFSEGRAVYGNFGKLVRAICVAERVAGVAFDRALLGHERPSGALFRPRLRVGRGAQIQRAARDSLYSEMVIID